MIDWKDPESKVSRFFTVKEAIWIPGWKRLADASDGFGTDQEKALVDLFTRMDKVREFIDCPIIVHCAYRPPVYNSMIPGAAPQSAHMAKNLARADKRPSYLAACDWHPKMPGKSVQEAVEIVESMLVSKLEDFGLRMEKGRKTWIHTDTRPVQKGANRYFSP